MSPEPIILTIRSPKVPNLTLVDMPGLTKIATDNQPASIVKELEDMSRAYIKSPSVVVLAARAHTHKRRAFRPFPRAPLARQRPRPPQVSPANADIATSDAMRLVREFDPLGERTLGVLTKLARAAPPRRSPPGPRGRAKPSPSTPYESYELYYDS